VLIRSRRKPIVLFTSPSRAWALLDPPASGRAGKTTSALPVPSCAFFLIVLTIQHRVFFSTLSAVLSAEAITSCWCNFLSRRPFCFAVVALLKLKPPGLLIIVSANLRLLNETPVCSANYDAR